MTEIRGFLLATKDCFVVIIMWYPVSKYSTGKKRLVSHYNRNVQERTSQHKCTYISLCEMHIHIFTYMYTCTATHRYIWHLRIYKICMPTHTPYLSNERLHFYGQILSFDLVIYSAHLDWYTLELEVNFKYIIEFDQVLSEFSYSLKNIIQEICF